ncbi:glycosyltransferase family protein [Embleya sp. NPDC055664]
MRIGYSFWGFLGTGITDTPDGGRSHRRPLIDELLARGYDVVFLQANRDRVESGDDLGGTYSFDSDLPEIDVLFLEWRWPIPGRNTTPCGSPGHTCDLHRQATLLDHYTRQGRTPTIIWDKDRQLATDNVWRQLPNVAMCEAALLPSPGAHRLLFPVDDALLDAVDVSALAASPRPIPLAYVGNQYDRDDDFDRFLAPAAAVFEHRVGGKWSTTTRWPHVTFLGRVPFGEVSRLYGTALATTLLLPKRYARVGQMTQRIFEAVLAGCLPLAPAHIALVEHFVPGALIVDNGDQVIRRLRYLREIAGTCRHVDLLAQSVRRLELFRLTRQVDALERILDAVVSADTSHREVAR